MVIVIIVFDAIFSFGRKRKSRLILSIVSVGSYHFNNWINVRVNVRVHDWFVVEKQKRRICIKMRTNWYYWAINLYFFRWEILFLRDWFNVNRCCVYKINKSKSFQPTNIFYVFACVSLWRIIFLCYGQNKIIIHYIKWFLSIANATRVISLYFLQ